MALVLAGCLALMAACDSPTGPKTVVEAEKAIASDPQAAIIRYKSILQSKPDSTEARLLLGKAFLKAGDAASAEAELQRVSESSMPADRWAPSLAQALLALNKAPAVVSLYNAQKLTDPQAVAEMAVVAAQALQYQGDANAAQRAIDAAMQAAPEHVGVRVMDIRIKSLTASAAESLSRAQELARQHPDNAEVLRLLGDAEAGAGAATAEASYERALQREPRLTAAHSALIQLAIDKRDYALARQRVDRMAKAVPGNALAIYFDGMIAYLAGDFPRARERLALLLRGTADNPRVLTIAGMTEKELGAYGRADALLSKSLVLDPDNESVRRELADLAIALGQPDRALRLLEQAMRQEAARGDASYWLVLGKAHAFNGNFSAADAAFAKAKSLQPTAASTRLEYARSLLARGSADGGIRELEAAAAGPDGARAALELVVAHLGKRNLTAALAAVDKLQALAPKSAQPDLLRGRIFEERGDKTQAIAAYEAALAKEPTFFAPVMQLARLDLAAANRDRAIERLSAFTKRNPDTGAAWLMLAETYRQAGKPVAEVRQTLDRANAVAPADAEAWIGAIEIEERLGSDSATLTRAQRALAQLPESPEILFHVSRAQAASGQRNQAMATLQTLAGLRPKAAAPRLHIADLHLATGDLRGARQAVDKARELEPASLEVVRAHTLLLLKEGSAKEALLAARERRKSHPKEVPSMLLEADALSVLGQSAASVAVLKEALALEPTSMLALRISDESRNGGDAAGAAKFESEWMRKHPDDIDFVGYLAQQAAGRGDNALAQSLYRKVVQARPDAALSLNNLATLLLKDKPAEAAELALRANKLIPNSPPLLDTLSHAYEALGEFDKAWRIQARAVELDSRNLAWQLALARMQIKGGERDKAKTILRRLANEGKAFQAQDEVQRLLKSIDA